MGEDAGEATEEEKAALKEAVGLLNEVLATAEKLKNERLTCECLRMMVQTYIQAEDVDNAKSTLERLTSIRPDEDELKSDNARINKLQAALALKNGANAIETVQKDLQDAITGADEAKVMECLTTIMDMMVNAQVTWDTIRTLKVGKDVGNAMKMGDPDVAAQARKVVGEIQALATRNGLGL